MSFIQSLQLHNFRCYDSVRMDGLHPGLVVLTGANGAGKTNILEAVSLLTPGRGLRGASNEDMQKKGAAAGWAIASVVETGGASVQIGTGLEELGAKRGVRINGVSAKSQIALADYLSAIWLTPQMDRIFIDTAGGRRRFFDKLVFAFDSSHAGRVTRYENAMSQRSKLLREQYSDPVWLAGLESQMAETGVAIAAARLEFVRKLQRACDLAHENEEGFFPKARLHLSGTVEELLGRAPAVEVEEMFAYQLKQSRPRDAETGGAATGPHKGDLLVRFAAKDMPADQCSTGEQKALLIGIILAHARLLKAETGAPPILLLDEVAAHLDENRRAALFDLLIATGGQVWMTGTDKSLFSAAENRAQFHAVEAGRIALKNG
ncbi:MAG: DNA replication/repair protein RecF [Micavibrio aeruginosavorus]|uniref:DNA replication and repair protein RecF n=1 Tax=Micavibrio aeruginosavorus TaxID=349221 RepID=A0A2W5BVE7_9BACT|nr:MAG: DNA replication/repair protein RecF [Micavibrio aeruginosavorus]